MTRPVRDGASPDGLPPLRDVIERHGLFADKALGQNFILDFNLTRRIARAGGPVEGRTVVEIGPGPGGLTRALLMEGAAHVIAVEQDERCRPALDEIAAHHPGRFTAVFADARRVDWRRLIADRRDRPIVAANLPYNIATTLLIAWLESAPWPPWYERMVLMFQREVAERIVAGPSSKAYGRLAVIAQWRTQARLLFTLAPNAFVPPPKIESAVVAFMPREAPHPLCDVTTLGRVTAAAFGQRRKMLRQSLRALGADPEPLLAAAGIDGTRRAETLSVREMATLAAVYGRLIS
jgi:16S rRNA (adenine1518-N6/adenine1519-N6)-dimethyltransferase